MFCLLAGPPLMRWLFFLLTTLLLVAVALAEAKYTNGTISYPVNVTTLPNGDTQVMLDIPPREMWGWYDNVDGYCGECSFQSAMLYYGNYVSQEEVRYSDGNKELLVAVNDEKAAKTLRLQYESWDYNRKTPQGSDFVKWVTEKIDDGFPVISGWYERVGPTGGDADYDHIMPIVGYVKSSTGAIGLYHNDLYIQDHTLTAASELFATRSECRQSRSPTRPYDYCLPKDVNYGIAIKGNLDPNGETLRMKLKLSHWDEPDWGEEDGLHEKPIQLEVTATVYGLAPGVGYAIVRYDDERAVPTSNSGFIKGSWSAKFSFVATAETMEFSLDPIPSDGIYLYRCVVGQ